MIKTGIYPLIRLALLMNEMDLIISIFAVITAVFGITYAIFEKDVKRMLAWSTISQIGFVLITPYTAGIYALSHGVAKSALFLMAGALPTRNLNQLQNQKISSQLWLGLTLASLSITGIPLVVGFVAKVLTLKELTSWQFIVMNIAAVGTAIVFAKFIFLSHSPAEKVNQDKGFWLAIVFLLLGLFFTNLIYPSAYYSISNITKSLAKIAIGWTIYLLVIKKIVVSLPRSLEKIDNLIGVMSLTLVVLFWLVIPSL